MILGILGILSYIVLVFVLAVFNKKLMDQVLCWSVMSIYLGSICLGLWLVWKAALFIIGSFS